MKSAACILLYTFCLFSHSCKTVRSNTAKDNTAIAPGPMQCKIHGVIAGIIKIKDEDAGSVCSKYPCRAKVRIAEVYGCGSSVSLSLNAGDTIDMKFVYTLHDTRKIFPAMKTQYPGLKTGDTFIAVAEQRLKPGSSGEFVIYDYVRQ